MRVSVARTPGVSITVLRQNVAAQALRPLPIIHQQCRKQHAVSNPTLANIEKRWEGMPPQEQAELWMALRDRMTVDWNEMTTQEKKACSFTRTIAASFSSTLGD